jgi:hypothetical protein
MEQSPSWEGNRIGYQLVKLPTFYGTRRLITVSSRCVLGCDVTTLHGVTALEDLDLKHHHCEGLKTCSLPCSQKPTNSKAICNIS